LSISIIFFVSILQTSFLYKKELIKRNV
jgi:hypothetical protein